MWNYKKGILLNRKTTRTSCQGLLVIIFNRFYTDFLYYRDSDSIDDNAVGPPNSNPYDVQEASLQFTEESDKQNDIDSPDTNIKAALKAREALKNNNNYTKNGKLSNGNIENGALDTRIIEGLQTTEI